MIFRLPKVKDNAVEIVYDISIRDRTLIRSGRGTYVMRPAKGGWTIVEKNESLPGFDPREDPHALHIGGHVKAPVKIDGAEPVPTAAAAKAGISGIVILELTLDEQGKVIGAHVLKPLPFGLDQATVDAVSAWQFRPARSPDVRCR